MTVASDGGRTCGLRQDHSLRCWGYNLTSEPAQIGDAFDWRTASVRYEYFCGIKTDGSLWCGDDGIWVSDGGILAIGPP